MNRKGMQNIFVKRLSGLLCAWLFPFAALYAQVDTTTYHQLSGVEVLGKVRPSTTRESTPLQVMDKAGIERLGVQDLSEAVKRFSGVTVQDYGGIGGLKTVSVRSLGAKHTAVCYDGVTVTDAQSGQVDISRFSLDNVDMISLSIGQADDIFQTARMYASAGALSIKTSRPVFTDRSYHLKAQVKAGSFGLVNPYLRYEQKLGKKWYTSWHGDYLRADGNYPFTLVNGNLIEKYLRGEKGIEILLRDAHGRIQGHYMDGEYDRPSVPGKNLTLSLDIDLQMLGERLLKNKIGSIVAIEPETGEILCLVSSPNYDPHLMIGRQRGKNHLALQRDMTKPLLNRALMGVYPPGSTFKTAQGLTFLQEGIITEQSPAFPCSHGFHYGRLTVGCHAHGSPLPLIPAIATSCNSYFCWGLFRMFGDRKYGSPQNAITVWKDHMVSQGFGYKLGVDLPGEKRGLIPNAQFYDKAYRGHWNGLTVISISIGQGEILSTPLQIANLGATIANRGYFVTPHIVKEIQDNQLDSIYCVPRYTTIEKRHYESVVEGMRGAATGGTCRMLSVMVPDLEACGKTGTAQNRGHDHSVFMGFAPMNKPKIAIAVYVENGGWGATYGVPFGALMMEQYLKGKLSPENELRAEEFSNRVILYGNEER